MVRNQKIMSTNSFAAHRHGLATSGGTSETYYQLLRILAKHACALAASRCPTACTRSAGCPGVRLLYFIRGTQFITDKMVITRQNKPTRKDKNEEKE